MRIVVAHNSYRQAGGEDRVVADEIAMLEAHGHEVIPYRVSNLAIGDAGTLTLAASTVWSRGAYRELRALFRAHRPHLVHFHNTLPLISPAGYYAARSEGVPVVQTLHNFRLFCVNALLFRDGVVCEDCLGRRTAWPGVVRKCYRGSFGGSAAVAAMAGVHRAFGTWQRAVDCYIALSESSRRKFVAGGLPSERVVVKPNFVYPDPGPGHGSGGYALYVGRLSAEKGLQTLIGAWQMAGRALPLKVVGDGPLAPQIAAAAAVGTLEWLRELPYADVCRLVGEAAMLVLPSQCYENFPRVIIEAFASATPVVTSRLGAMAEIVADGETGLLFRPGDPADLAAKVSEMTANAPRLTRMRAAARAAFEQHYTAATNHEALMRIYAHAMAVKAPSATPTQRFCAPNA